MADNVIRLMDGKPWRCENGHLLGVMRRERTGHGSGHTYRLYKLAKALEADPAADAPLEWISKPEGTCHDILCEVCGARKTWYAGQAALNGIYLEPRGPQDTDPFAMQD